MRHLPSRPELWAVRLETSSTLAEIIADILEPDALALTVLAPPRSSKARVEVLYAEKPARADLTALIAVAAALHKTRMPKLGIEKLPSLDWLGKVAGDFPPLSIARWIVHGAHYKAAITDRRRALQIDATNAFGTGEHPTTRGCLLALDKLLKQKGGKNRRMLDMGCGSGILAMAWAKAVPGRALGVDNDPLSVRIARNNAQVNGLGGRMRFTLGQGYVGRVVRQQAPYGLIMANIFAKPLAVMAKDLKRNLQPGGTAILSGLLTHQANRVLSAHRMQKVYLARRFQLGEWSVLVLKRKVS